MKILNTAAAIALLAATATASALTIDSDIYFSYARLGGQTITLSHRPCENPEFSRYGWKKANHIWADGTNVPSCWKPDKGTTLSVCWVNEDYAKGLYGCMPGSKGRFMDTSSLPAAAKF